MGNTGEVAGTGSRPLSSESWTLSGDICSILAGDYIVSIHKPEEHMRFAINPYSYRSSHWSILDVDASLLIKRYEPPPAFLPKSREPSYQHVLDAQFKDGKFLFGSEYHPPYSGQPITKLDDLKKFFTVEIGSNALNIFQKPGLLETYRKAVSQLQ